MSINKELYQRGIKGLLSEEEIILLPRDYEMHKGSFLEATEFRKELKKMEFNIDNKKILKVIVRKDDGNLIDFTFKDGEIVDAVTLGDTIIIEHDNDKKESTDSLNESFNTLKLNAAEERLNHGVKLAKKILEMDKNGKLNEMVKKHRNEINDKISSDYDYKDKDGKQLDITICEKSIHKLKNELISSLSKLGKNAIDDEDFWDKVNTYKEYISKRDFLSNELLVEQIDEDGRGNS